MSGDIKPYGSGDSAAWTSYTSSSASSSEEENPQANSTGSLPPVYRSTESIQPYRSNDTVQSDDTVYSIQKFEEYITFLCSDGAEKRSSSKKRSVYEFEFKNGIKKLEPNRVKRILQRPEHAENQYLAEVAEKVGRVHSSYFSKLKADIGSTCTSPTCYGIGTPVTIVGIAGSVILKSLHFAGYAISGAWILAAAPSMIALAVSAAKACSRG